MRYTSRPCRCWPTSAFARRDDTGKAFDPALHEAVGTIADEELVPGTVAQVVRAGYGSDDEILRPAAVVVATRSD